MTTQQGRELSGVEIDQDELLDRVRGVHDASREWYPLGEQELLSVLMERNQLRADVEQLRALLRDLEWTGIGDLEYCPICGMSKGQGHEAGCRLGALLP